jgi:hypothetical protein
MRGMDYALDNWTPFCAVTIKELLAPATTDSETQLPDQIPNILQSGIHSLSAEWAMNVRCIAGDEYPPHVHSSYVTMMNVEIAAPA